jgi:hypothetical protein
MSANYRRPATTAQKAKAEAAREEKLQALHDRLTEQVSALRSGEDWQRWLRSAARFHDYSTGREGVFELREYPLHPAPLAGARGWHGG